MKHAKSGAVIALLLLFLTAGCISPIPDSIKHCYTSGNWVLDNFSVQFFNNNWDFQCVEKVAIQERNHTLCFHLHTSVDSICTQDYYEAVNDPTVCDRELGGMENCRRYYGIDQNKPN